MKNKPIKKKKWIKFRHRVVTKIAKIIVVPLAKLKYGVKINKFKEQGKRKYFIISNHQTAYDQFFISMAFKGAVYYVASEDLLSNGFVSKLIKYLVGAIPIKKQTTDVRAVMNCMQVAKEGGTIAVFPEGNRTFSGKTEYMNPAIIPLIKKLNLPLAIFKIQGGYGVQPRWSDVKRKGKMTAGVVKVVEPREYANMTDGELFELVKSQLFVDETKDQSEFLHKKRAEYLERAVYVCPKCGFSEFYSANDEIKCLKCGLKTTYKPNKTFDEGFPFRNVNEWYEYQKDFVNGINPNDYINEPIYTNKSSVYQVKLYKKKELLCQDATVKLYGNRMEVSGEETGEINLSFDEVSAVSVLGRNKLNVYYKDKVYQFKSEKRFNALKYVNLYYRYNNVSKGDINGKFLGL